ncbi:MAG: holo-ACP synthase [Actinomycetota bacterium]
MAINGTGIDLIEIHRIEQAVSRFGDRLLKRVFSEREIAYASGKANPYPSLAARFAAKEAFIKALSPISSDGLSLNEIELVAGEGLKKPGFTFYGRSREIVEAAGLTRIAVSLTHSREYAAAIVILEVGD